MFGSHNLPKNGSSMGIGHNTSSREIGKPYFCCLILIIINPENKQENLREDTIPKKGKGLPNVGALLQFCISSTSLGNESFEQNCIRTKNIVIIMPENRFTS